MEKTEKEKFDQHQFSVDYPGVYSDMQVLIKTIYDQEKEIKLHKNEIHNLKSLQVGITESLVVTGKQIDLNQQNILNLNAKIDVLARKLKEAIK